MRMTLADADRSERLRSVDLTSGLDRVALARLAAYMDPLPVVPGQAICVEGDPADALYIVVRGRFGVFVGIGPDERRVNTVGPGHYVGELALLIDEPRSATIRAETEGEVLRLAREQFVELLGRDAAAAKAVATTLARRLRRRDVGPSGDDEAMATELAPPAVGAGRRPIRKIAGLIVATALVAAALSPLVDLAQWRFTLLLLAAIALWVTEPVPNVVASLGLVALWIVSGLAFDYATLAGFASLNWVFVVAVLGLAGAVGRSGLLLRVGLLIIERVPARLGWQAAAFLGTGIVLTPLLPMAMARAAITAPLAEGVADALKLPDRSPAAATVGLSAWIGSGPFLFLFLNGSPVCLLAWSLMPLAAQRQFTWTQWFVSAAPLAAFIAVGMFVALRLFSSAQAVAAPSQGPLRLQRAILGPLSRQELTILVIVLLTLAGWVFGPRYLIAPGLVALIAFIAVMVVTGVSGLAQLDWEYLVFYGVALSAGEHRRGSPPGQDRGRERRDVPRRDGHRRGGVRHHRRCVDDRCAYGPARRSGDPSALARPDPGGIGDRHPPLARRRRDPDARPELAYPGAVAGVPRRLRRDAWSAVQPRSGAADGLHL